MRYASTYINEHGHEIVAVILPLSAVPKFDPDFPSQQNTYGVPSDVEVGWERGIDGVFMPYTAPAPAVPKVVTMRQARIALHRAGHLTTVQTAMPSLGTEAEIEWEYATEVHRDSALVVAMAQLLSLDAGALDALFVSAAGIA